MMMNNTLAQLRELKLVGMATAVEEQLSSTASTTLSFEERLALMVDREVHQRADKRHAALLKRARLKYPQACIEDVDGRTGRGFERSALMSLALSRWVEDGTAILITGPTGSGKSWLACALAQYACRRGQSALYLRVPRLAEELRILHGNGGFTFFRKGFVKRLITHTISGYYLIRPLEFRRILSSLLVCQQKPIAKIPR